MVINFLIMSYNRRRVRSKETRNTQNNSSLRRSVHMAYVLFQINTAQLLLQFCYNVLFLCCIFLCLYFVLSCNFPLFILYIIIIFAFFVVVCLCIGYLKKYWQYVCMNICMYSFMFICLFVLYTFVCGFVCISICMSV